MTPNNNRAACRNGGKHFAHGLDLYIVPSRTRELKEYLLSQGLYINQHYRFDFKEFSHKKAKEYGYYKGGYSQQATISFREAKHQLIFKLQWVECAPPQSGAGDAAAFYAPYVPLTYSTAASLPVAPWTSTLTWR